MSGDKFSATRIFVFWMQNIVIWCGVFNKIAEHENSIANSSCSSQGVDVVAGVEAIISHLVVKEFQIPCAHAPALLPPPLTRSLSPRSAAEEVSDLPTAVFFHHGISDHRKKKKKKPIWILHKTSFKRGGWLHLMRDWRFVDSPKRKVYQPWTASISSDHTASSTKNNGVIRRRWREKRKSMSGL